VESCHQVHHAVRAAGGRTCGEVDLADRGHADTSALLGLLRCILRLCLQVVLLDAYSAVPNLDFASAQAANGRPKNSGRFFFFCWDKKPPTFPAILFDIKGRLAST